MRRWLKPVLLLPLLAGGCVTHKLWTESQLDEWNEPARNPNLRLFRDGRKNDLVVVYDEYSERHESTRARAFLLNQSEKSLAQQNHPHFVGLHATNGLASVPVLYSAPTNFSPMLYAVTGTNSRSFMFFSGGREIIACELPVYADGWGRIERVAWTPFAVTADLTIVGGWIGCLWIYSGGPGVDR